MLTYFYNNESKYFMLIIYFYSYLIPELFNRFLKKLDCKRIISIVCSVARCRDFFLL